MSLIKRFFLLLLVGRGLGLAIGPSPQDMKVPFDKRDATACSPETMPIDTLEGECLKKNIATGNECIAAMPKDATGSQGCTAYCEQNISKSYGREVPFSAGSCEAFDECTLSIGASVTYTNQYATNGSLNFDLKNRHTSSISLSKRDNSPSIANLKASFDIGASYSYSESLRYSASVEHNRGVNDPGCGYWTFIPYIIESCGFLTVADLGQTGEGDSPADACSNQYQTDLTYCTKTPVRSIDDQLDGVITFIKVDCTTNLLLPMEQQVEAYQYPGVSTGHE